MGVVSAGQSVYLWGVHLEDLLLIPPPLDFFLDLTNRISLGKLFKDHHSNLLYTCTREAKLPNFAPNLSVDVRGYSRNS